jgi:hypothetical protein
MPLDCRISRRSSISGFRYGGDHLQGDWYIGTHHGGAANTVGGVEYEPVEWGLIHQYFIQNLAANSKGTE